MAREAISALLWTRAIVWAAGLLALGAFGLLDGYERFDPSGLTDPFSELGDALVAPAARWDAVWFTAVARDGYDGARAAFFPLYPMLARAAGMPFGSPLIGAIVVAFAAAWAGLWAVGRLAAIELGAGAVRPAVWALAAFPTSLFLSAAYSESLFLALTAGAFLAARRERWALVALLGALAAATRSAGVLLVIPLALLAWPHGWRARLAAAAAPLGLLAYCGYLELAIGDAWAPFAAQDVWFRSFAGPFGAVPAGIEAGWEGLCAIVAGDGNEAARRNAIDLAFLVVAASALVGVFRRLPLAYGAWALAALALPLSYPVEPQPLMSLPRFLCVLFPLHLWLAARGFGHRGIAVGCGLLALFSAEFTTWRFVA